MIAENASNSMVERICIKRSVFEHTPDSQSVSLIVVVLDDLLHVHDLDIFNKESALKHLQEIQHSQHN